MSCSPKDVTRALVDAYNDKSVERLLELYAPDGRYWDPMWPEGVEGTDALRTLYESSFAAAPDERMEIVALAGDERFAVAELRRTGTLAGAGARFQLDLTAVHHVADGRIAACRAYYDPRQLPRGTHDTGHPARDESDSGTTKGRSA